MRIFFLISLLFFAPTALLAEVKLVELKYRPASELVEKVRGILDVDEKVTDAGNHLVLVADGESLAAAVQMISLLDRELTPLVVRLRHAESRQRLAQGTSGSVSYSNRGQRNVALSPDRTFGNASSNTEQTLRVLEGEGGWLQVGQDVPFTEEWAVLTGESSGYAEQISYQTIAVGFWVHPVKLVPGGVLVDIEPRLSRLAGEDTDPPEIRFNQSRTRMQLPFGQWHPLASYLLQADRVSQAIVNWRSDTGVSDEELFIRIDPAAGFSP